MRTADEEERKTGKGVEIALRRYIEMHLENYPQDLAELELCDPADDGLRLKRTREVCAAIGTVLERQDDETLKLIKLKYWEKKYNLTGAGAAIYLTRDQAYSRVNRLIAEIAAELGEI